MSVPIETFDIFLALKLK